VRSVLLGVLLFFVSPGCALAADVVTLQVRPDQVRYGNRVELSGTITPAVAGEPVAVYARAGAGAVLVGSTATDGLGSFSLRTAVTTHRVFLARATDAFGNPVESAPASVLVRPRIAISLRGSRRIAARLFVVGHVLPRVAGTVALAEDDHVRKLTIGPGGRFQAELTTTRRLRYRATVRLLPAAGYIGWHRTYSVRIKPVPLTIGSRSPAVNWLKYSLHRIHHFALPSVAGVYDVATADAVLAFQRVHGLPLTGSVDGRFWQILGTSRPPPARIPSGDHIEVDKTRQLLFEVRAGRVVSVSRVSTGATGNTPVGHWHVYAKGPGFNAKGMYDSLFFLRGFAIHGYPSVPAYPASHGCVRIPMWIAPTLYAMHSQGTTVVVHL